MHFTTVSIDFVRGRMYGPRDHFLIYFTKNSTLPHKWEFSMNFSKILGPIIDCTGNYGYYGKKAKNSFPRKNFRATPIYYYELHLLADRIQDRLNTHLALECCL